MRRMSGIMINGLLSDLSFCSALIAVAGIQVPVKIRKVAGSYDHLNAMSLLKKVADVQQINRVLVNLRRRQQRRMLHRFSGSCPQNAILQSLRLTIWMNINDLCSPISVFG